MEIGGRPQNSILQHRFCYLSCSEVIIMRYLYSIWNMCWSLIKWLVHFNISSIKWTKMYFLPDLEPNENHLWAYCKYMMKWDCGKQRKVVQVKELYTVSGIDKTRWRIGQIGHHYLHNVFHEVLPWVIVEVIGFYIIQDNSLLVTVIHRLKYLSIGSLPLNVLR